MPRAWSIPSAGARSPSSPPSPACSSPPVTSSTAPSPARMGLSTRSDGPCAWRPSTSRIPRTSPRFPRRSCGRARSTARRPCSPSAWRDRRSPLGRIEIHGLDLREELARRLALLARAAARALEAAERHLGLGARRLRVDVDDARVDLADEAQGQPQVAGDDGCPQAEPGIVATPYRLFA